MAGGALPVCAALSLASCGGAAPDVAPPPAPVRNTADVAADDPAACVEAVRDRPMLPPYVVPTGSPAFRAAISARGRDLACCLPGDVFGGAGREGIRIQVELQSGADGGGHVTGSPFAEDVVACLDAVLATWRMPAIGADSITPGAPSRAGRLNLPIMLAAP